MDQEKSLNEMFQSDLGKAGMLSLPITLVVLVSPSAPGRGRRPADLALTGVLATIALVASRPGGPARRTWPR